MLLSSHVEIKHVLIFSKGGYYDIILVEFILDQHLQEFEKLKNATNMIRNIVMKMYSLCLVVP
jgi:hypothetical protein